MTTVVVNGFFLGLVYGLLAAGLVVVYRGSRIINFAYGETGMIGAFLFSELWTKRQLPLVVALLIAVAVSAGLGAATEVVVVRPLRHEPPLTAMVGTLAVASLIFAYASRRYGLHPHYLPQLWTGQGVRLGGLTIQRGQILILIVTAVLLLGLTALYRGTSFGLRMRATAQDPTASGLVGVNTNATSLLTWGLAGGLAAISGILVAPTVSFSVFFMTSLLLRSLAAALVGGLTSLGGAVGAGILLGITEGVLGYLVPAAGVVEVTLALFVIVLLLVRPSGLVRSAY